MNYKVGVVVEVAQVDDQHKNKDEEYDNVYQVYVNCVGNLE